MYHQEKVKSGVTREIMLCAAFSCLFFCSCVSLKTPKRTDIVPLQTSMSLGKYPVRFNETYHSSADKDTVIPTVIWYFFKNSAGADSLEINQATHFELRLTDEKHVSATLFNGNTALKTDTKKGRLRKGYFRMKHSFSLSGIPPFYWSTSSSKIQFGIGSAKQLYIDAADETNGSILIVVAGTPGFTHSITVPVYEK